MAPRVPNPTPLALHALDKEEWEVSLLIEKHAAAETTAAAPPRPYYWQQQQQQQQT